MISAHKIDRFMVIVSTVNMVEEFYPKMGKICMTELDSPKNKDTNIGLCICYNVKLFKEFHKAVHDEVNIFIITYNTTSKCLRAYERNKKLDDFLVMDEAHLLLQHISLIEITKKLDKVAFIRPVGDDIKYFVCFNDYIIANQYIKKKYLRQ